MEVDPEEGKGLLGQTGELLKGALVAPAVGLAVVTQLTPSLNTLSTEGANLRKKAIKNLIGTVGTGVALHTALPAAMHMMGSGGGIMGLMALGSSSAALETGTPARQQRPPDLQGQVVEQLHADSPHPRPQHLQKTTSTPTGRSSITMPELQETGSTTSSTGI